MTYENHSELLWYWYRGLAYFSLEKYFGEDYYHPPFDVTHYDIKRLTKEQVGEDGRLEAEHAAWDED